MGIGDHGNKVGRPTDYTQHLGDVIAGMIAEGLPERKICTILKLHHSAISRWKHMFPEFQEQAKRAKDDYTCGKVERRQFRSAMGYRFTETTRELSPIPGKDGEAKMIVTKKVSKVVQASTAAQQHVLHNLDPARWKKMEHRRTHLEVGLLDPVKSLADRREEFVDAEIVEDTKQITDEKNRRDV